MATAFTDQEREAIRQALLRSALEHAPSEGLRKTTIETLAEDAGISKGAFYKFYESKEHLFLAVLETLYEEMYGNAERALAEHVDLPMPERVAGAIRGVCAALREHQMSRFILEDVPLLLRRLPEPVLREHYQSDEEHIRHLLVNESIRLSIPLERACVLVRMLMLTLLHERQLGPEYPRALSTMIDAVCERVVVA